MGRPARTSESLVIRSHRLLGSIRAEKEREKEMAGAYKGTVPHSPGNNSEKLQKI